MSKKTKYKILIVFLYFISFLILDLIIGIGTFDENAKEVIDGNYNVFALFAPFAEAGFYHFIFISCIAIYVRFNKKITTEYKHIIYWFPLCTFILALPMCIPTAIVARLLNIPFGNV